MDRIARPGRYVNHPCFGFEYDRTKPECQRCVLLHLCGKVFGNRVTLDRIKFDLTPPGLLTDDEVRDINGAGWRRTQVEDTFRRCYFVIFNSKWPEATSLGKDWENIVKNAQAANVSVNTFIATLMAAWKLTHPNSPFYVNNLTASTSAAKVSRLSRIIREHYGHNGVEALGMYCESSTPCIEDQMKLSETLAGKWIIGCKLVRDGSAVQSLYRQHELSLDPHWLAIEPTYIEMVLKPYMNSDVNESAAIKAHRERVLSTHSMLKSRKALARTIFGARTQIMPSALISVLKGVGHTPENFTYADKPVTDALKFWNVLGLAVQQWECVKALQAQPNRLWR